METSIAHAVVAVFGVAALVFFWFGYRIIRSPQSAVEADPSFSDQEFVYALSVGSSKGGEVEKGVSELSHETFVSNILVDQADRDVVEFHVNKCLGLPVGERPAGEPDFGSSSLGELRGET